MKYPLLAAGLGSGLLALLAGCTFERYRPLPLAPGPTATAYQTRSLADSALHRFLRPLLGDSLPATPTAAWSVPALTYVAFYYHPDLDVARGQLQLAQGQRRTAAQRPNPRAGLNAAYNYRPGEVPMSPWLFTPSLDFTIETAGKRRYRLRQADVQLEAARLNVGVVAWQVKSRVRAQLTAYLLAQEEQRLLREEVQVRGETADSLQTLFGFGELTLTDLELSRLTLADARLRQVAGGGAARERRALLAGSLGLPDTVLSGPRLRYPGLLGAPPPVPLGDLEGAVLANNLALQRGQLDYAAAEAALQLEVARQYPDVVVGPSLRFYQGQRRAQLSPGVDLPIFHHNQGPVAEAKANREIAAARYLQTQALVLTELARTRAAYAAARAEYATAQGLRRATEARGQNIKAVYDTGDLTYLDLLSTRLETVLARQGELRALVRLHAALGSLEDVVQKPLTPGLTALPNLEQSPRPLLSTSVPPPDEHDS